MSNFHPIVVHDERIQSITTDLAIEMKKAGSQNTYQSQNASSMSTTGVTFNVTPPSQHVIMDRHVKMSNEIEIQVNIPAGRSTGSRVFQYGETEALSAFPMNSLITTANVTINSATVNVNTQDFFGTLSKMHDQEDFDEYHAPTMLDQKFKYYKDMPLTQSNPLGSFENSKSNIVPRGSHPLLKFTYQRLGTDPLSANETKGLDDIIAALTCTNADQSWVLSLTFVTIEPLLFLSPLVYSKTNNNAGLFGLNKLDLQLNLDPTAKRVLCSSTDAADVPMTVQLIEVKNSMLLMTFITPQASDLISPSNVVPYTEYNRHITAQAGNKVAPGASVSIVSNSTLLSCIPSKIYVVARKQLQNMTCKDSDSFMAITGCTIQFNNMSGIYSSATQHDLYTMSKKNGSKQSAYEFYGVASVKDGFKRPTMGSVLVLDPVDFGLPEYLAPGSTGQFNFQINITAKNTDDIEITYELMVITQNDGIFITQSGQSTKQTSLFSKALVAESSMSQYGESSDHISKFTTGHSLTNVPLLNIVKSGSGSVKSGGAYSGGGAIGNSLQNTAGDYTRKALSRFSAGI